MRLKFFKILLLLLISQFQIHFVFGNTNEDIPPPWNPINTGSNHTILIPEFATITINDLSIDSGDYIGIFFDSLGTLVCGGFTMWDNSTTAIAAWGEDAGFDGFISGEKFKCKLWDSSEGKEYNAIPSFDGEDFPSYDSYVSNGMSGIISIKGYPEQIISLHEGWNFFTSFITPIQPAWEDLFDGIDSLIIVNKNFDDTLFWPSAVNGTISYSAAESYKIKAKENLIVNFWGKQLLPEDTTFLLLPTMQAIPYIRTQLASIESLFDEAFEDIKLIKSEDGLLLWPAMSTSQLVNFSTGSAYQIIMYDTISYIFPSNDSIIYFSEDVFTTDQFYNPNLNTGNNMSLGILNSAWNITLSQGDEIGVFSKSGSLIGAGLYENDNLGITIWGNDETTEVNEAIEEGIPFVLKLRHIEDGFEDNIIVNSWLEGDSIYIKDKISIIDEIEIIQDEEERTYNMQINPNYSQGLFHLIISVPESTSIIIKLFDINGRHIKNILISELETGKHIFDIYLNNISQGIYLFKMETPKKTIYKKVSILGFNN